MSDTVHSSLKSAVKGTAFMLFGFIASTALWLASKIIIIRSISKEDLGIYTLSVTVISITALLAGGGIQNGVTHFISTYLGQGNVDEASSTAKGSMQIVVASGLLSSLAFYLLAAPMARYVFYNPALIEPFQAISTFNLFYIGSITLVAILRGYDDIRPQTYFVNIGQPLLFILLVLACFWLKLPFINLIYSYVATIAIVSLAMTVYSRKRLGFNVLSVTGGKHRVELMRFSLPLIVVAIMAVLLVRIDTLMLGRYTTAEIVGEYSVSVSLGMLMTFALAAASFVFMPIASELKARNQIIELKRSYQVLTKWIFAGSLPLFCVLFFFPEMTITYLFGERFLSASVPLSILSLGFLVQVFFGVNSIVLTAFGYTKALMNVSTIVIIVNIALNYIFIKILGQGMIGAATATAISYAIGSLLNAILLYRASGIHPLTAGHFRPLGMLAIIGSGIYLLAKSLPLHLWLMPIYLVAFMGCYVLIILYSRSLDQEDVKLLGAIAGRVGLDVDRVKAALERFARH